MVKSFYSRAILLYYSFFSLQIVEAQTCKPSGKLSGKKAPPKQCNQGNDSDCCKEGELYTTYKCSLPVSSHTKALRTINGFNKSEDAWWRSIICDNKYHSDDIPVVALSTGWFNGRSRCLKNIVIHGNGCSMVFKVVDECDSTKQCDKDHDYQPPCPHNVVDASRAVWEAMGVPSGKLGEMDITWSDAWNPYNIVFIKLLNVLYSLIDTCRLLLAANNSRCLC